MRVTGDVVFHGDGEELESPTTFLSPRLSWFFSLRNETECTAQLAQEKREIEKKGNRKMDT